MSKVKSGIKVLQDNFPNFQWTEKVSGLKVLGWEGEYRTKAEYPVFIKVNIDILMKGDYLAFASVFDCQGMQVCKFYTDSNLVTSVGMVLSELTQAVSQRHTALLECRS